MFVSEKGILKIMLLVWYKGKDIYDKAYRISIGVEKPYNQKKKKCQLFFPNFRTQLLGSYSRQKERYKYYSKNTVSVFR